MQVDLSTGDVIQPSFVLTTSYPPYGMGFDHAGNMWVAETNSVDEYNQFGALINSIVSTDFNLVLSAAFNPNATIFYAAPTRTRAPCMGSSRTA